MPAFFYYQTLGAALPYPTQSPTQYTYIYIHGIYIPDTHSHKPTLKSQTAVQVTKNQANNKHITPKRRIPFTLLTNKSKTNPGPKKKTSQKPTTTRKTTHTKKRPRPDQMPCNAKKKENHANTQAFTFLFQPPLPLPPQPSSITETWE